MREHRCACKMVVLFIFDLSGRGKKTGGNKRGGREREGRKMCWGSKGEREIEGIVGEKRRELRVCREGKADDDYGRGEKRGSEGS